MTPEKKVLSTDSLHCGEIYLTRTLLYTGDSLEGKIFLILEREEFPDSYLDNMKNGIIFSLLCDMAASFQALGHFKEAGKCLEEAEGRVKENMHLVILKSLNLVADKGCHTIEKLHKSKDLIDFALYMIKGQYTNFETDPNGKFMAGYIDARTTEDYAVALQSEIERTIATVENQNRVFLREIINCSTTQFKGMRQFKLASGISTNEIISKKQSLAIKEKPKAVNSRVRSMIKMYNN